MQQQRGTRQNPAGKGSGCEVGFWGSGFRVYGCLHALSGLEGISAAAKRHTAEPSWYVLVSLRVRVQGLWLPAYPVSHGKHQ
mgnify:CR=1 FL=1